MSYLLEMLDMNKVHYETFQKTNVGQKKTVYNSKVGSKTGGIYTILAGLIILAYFGQLILVMYSAENDLVTMKKLLIDFDDPEHTDDDDIQKFFHNYTLLPTMDVETSGNGDISEFDLAFDNNQTD